MKGLEPLSANPRALPMPLVGLCVLLIAVGLVSFVAGLLSDPATAWRAFHVNYIYYATLAQGGLCLSCALVIIGARWAGPIRHVAEALAAWVPITFVLCIVGYFGRDAIYTSWLEGGVPPGKEGWLTIPRVYLTDLAILGALTVLTMFYLRASFRPTLEGAAERATALKGMYASWTANWRGAEQEREASSARLRVLAPIIALTYVFGYTLVGYDQVMSLSPTWYSTMFGWYFGWGGFLCGVAATALVCVLLRANPDWQIQITRERMHDLGKMVFAFSIFWMYIFFAQYIVIWYGNLPEETEFIEARLGTQFIQDTWYFVMDRLEQPYVRLSLAAWVGNWVIPFWVLLGQRPKRTPVILGSVSALLLLGFWLERNALIWPSLVPDDGSAWFGPIQIGVAAGFLGAFVLVYLVFSRLFPSLPLPKRG